MADRLTQLQDCFDQLIIQMVACVSFVNLHHANAPIPGQPVPPPDPANPSEPPPKDPAAFNATLQELAADFVLKEQQIEALISVLPGVGSSSQAQMARMKALDAELRTVERERQVAVEVRDRLLERIDGVVIGLKRP